MGKKRQNHLIGTPSMPPSASRFYPLLSKIFIFAFAFDQFSLITADPDLWGHIEFGREAWLQKSPPTTDPYSYTAQGLPWINHEWLSEILYYLIYSWMGSSGLLMFKAALGLFILHLLSSLYFAKESNAFVYMIYFTLMATVMAPGFMTRPHLMTFLFLTLLMVLLQKFFSGDRKALAWAPVLTLVWANSHGGVVAGIGIFAAVTAVESARRLFTKENQDKTLSWFFALSCLALLVNPYGYKLWVFFFQTLTVPRDISEWNPVSLTGTTHLQFKVLAGFFALSLFIPGRKRPWEILIITLAVVYAFLHQRHTVLAVIVMTPYLPLKMAELANRIHLKSIIDGLSPTTHAVLKLSLAALTALHLFSGFSKNRANDFNILVEPGRYPTYAAQFMRANEINGNLLTPFDWGEFFIWTAPGSRVSIDGRFRTVYPEKLIRRHNAFATGQPQGKGLLEDYPTDIVVIRKSDLNRNKMDKEINWLKIYEDSIAKIYIKKTSPPGPVEKKFLEQKLLHPSDPPSFSFPE